MAEISGSGQQAYPSRNPVMANALENPCQQERALLHPRQRSYGNMRLAVITQFTVNFIRQHDEVVPDADAGDFLKGFHRGHRSVGFVGKLSISTLVRGVMDASSTSGFKAKRSLLLVGTAVATP